MRFSVHSCLLLGLWVLTLPIHADEDGTHKQGGAGISGAAAASATVAPAKPRIRLAADLGIAYCYAESKEGSSKAGDDLRTGHDLRLSVGYMATEKVAIGILYSGFGSSTTETVRAFDTRTGSYEDHSVDLEEDIRYVGLQLTSRSSTGKASFVASFGMGQLGYELEAREASTATATGAGLGLAWSLGGEFMVEPRLAIGFEFNLIRGTVENVRYAGQNLGDQDVSRIGAAAGLHFYL